MHPDFLIIPKTVHHNKKLRPTDWIVYATIYWFEHMKDGKCFAGNKALADIAQVSERAIMSSLERLEKYKYIKREYEDNKTRRTEIKSLVYYNQSPEKVTQVSLPGIEKPKRETPSDFAKRFFAYDPDALESIMNDVLAKTGGQHREQINTEFMKFILYWTELNKSGTKQRWQLQPTFDVIRRIYLWLGRAGINEKRSGSGITV